VSVKQFSASYIPLEDRIALSLNTTEGELYSFLLTRAITRSWIHFSEAAIEQSIGTEHNERSTKLISEFQKEGLKKQLNFEESFEGGDKAPLGSDPILVAQVQMDLQPDTVTISLTLVTNQVVGFGLPTVQLQALILLFERLASKADWKIAGQEVISIDSSSTAAISPSSQLH